MTDTTLATWLTISEAATRIGCSTRTIERLARAKKLEQRLRPQAGSPAVAVYNPDDVAVLAAQRQPAAPPFVLGAIPTGNGNGTGTRPFRNPEHGDSTALALLAADSPIQQFFALALRAIQSPPSPPVSATVSENPFLTVAEAAAWRRVSERLLLRWIRTGKLDAEREPRSLWTPEDRGWRIRRKDLEAL